MPQPMQTQWNREEIYKQDTPTDITKYTGRIQITPTNLVVEGTTYPVPETAELRESVEPSIAFTLTYMLNKWLGAGGTIDSFEGNFAARCSQMRTVHQAYNDARAGDSVAIVYLATRQEKSIPEVSQQVAQSTSYNQFVDGTWDEDTGTYLADEDARAKSDALRDIARSLGANISE